LFGEINATSGCSSGCFAGNMTLAASEALIYYPSMMTGDLHTAQCPYGFAGFVTLECGDSLPFVISGACYSHCPASRYAQGKWTADHPEIYHGQTFDRVCKDFFDGFVVLECDDGTVSLKEGGCYERCEAGQFMVRMGIWLQHGELGHGEKTPSKPCPSGYVGSARLECDDGEVVVEEGGCYQHCGAGSIQGAEYLGLLHTQNASLTCPIAGLLQVQCLDGAVSIRDGACVTGCAAGNITDSNGSVVVYPRIDHLGYTTGTCSGNSTGQVQVSCSDGAVTLIPLEGQRCVSHCDDSVNLTTVDGSILLAPPLDHGQEVPIKCPDGKPGSVMVRCSDGVQFVLAGTCGPSNCAAGSIPVGDAELAHPEMNDGGMTDSPTTCGTGYLGEAMFTCSEAVVSVLNVSLRYPAIVGLQAIDFNLSNVSEDVLARHDDEFFELCGCCTPAQLPPEPDPIAGVNLRKIVVWAVGLFTMGTVLAAIGGGWALRPESCRRSKGSRVQPEEEMAGDKPSAIVAYVDKPTAQKPVNPNYREQYSGSVADW